MKNNTVFWAIILIMGLGFGTLMYWYGDTKVALEPSNGILYRQITNGRVGVNCYDENGAKVIAPSRVSQILGPEWTPIAKLDGTGHTYSIACYHYRSLSNAQPIAASFPDQ